MYTLFFLCSKGLRQGCTLSPNLFNIYVNDLFNRLNSVNRHPPCLNNEQIAALMYADDLIILSLSHEGLQKCLVELNRYCKEWTSKANKISEISEISENSKKQALNLLFSLIFLISLISLTLASDFAISTNSANFC